MDDVMYKDYTIKIIRDEDPNNPRSDDYDTHLGTLVAFHRRYALSDDQHLSDGSKLDHNDFNNFDEMIEYVDKVEGGIIWEPVYLYDHSGITISTKPFSCPYDSGQVGFIYVSKKKVREWYEWDEITEEQTATIEGYLRDEITTFDQYLTGEVYYFTVLNPDGDPIESLCGFYGDNHEESGLLPEARSYVDADIRHREKTEGIQEELKL